MRPGACVGERIPHPAFAPLVQPVALGLHEMMSNAVKHGALAHPRGQVAVSAAEHAEQISLSWREHGVMGPTSSPSRGAGLRLLAGIIEQQLGGKVVMSWDMSGHAGRDRDTQPAPTCQRLIAAPIAASPSPACASTSPPSRRPTTSPA